MRKIILIILLLIIPSLCFAEIIRFTKTGYSIKAPILERTSRYIKVDFDGDIVQYSLDDIQSIDGEVITGAEKYWYEKLLHDEDGDTTSVSFYIVIILIPIIFLEFYLCFIARGFQAT